MPRKGWIKVHHELLDNSIWMEKPFDEGHAWVDLLLLATPTERDVEVAGIKIHQEPGSVLWTKKDLITRWGWTRWHFDKILAKWVELGMVTEKQHRNQHRNQHRIVTELTVVKWGHFQGSRSKTNTENSTENDKPLKKDKEGDGERLSRRHATKKKGLVTGENGRWGVTKVAD